VHGLVAESNGALLGLTHYLSHRSTIAIEPVCYLPDLFTAEASRRKGVGRALIEEVHRQAKLSGCGRVYWHTQETNRTARALYDKVAEHLGSSGITNSFDTLSINAGAARASGKRAEPRKCPP